MIVIWHTTTAQKDCFIIIHGEQIHSYFIFMFSPCSNLAHLKKISRIIKLKFTQFRNSFTDFNNKNLEKEASSVSI